MNPVELDKSLQEDVAVTGHARWSRIDAWMETAGERLNPILVKEARQALKSRQFVMTFNLLLICGWGWSVLALSLGRIDDYRGIGATVFTGYFVILCVPLLIIVPYAAFQSLAAERQDGTFELLSITSLGARQIVMGKLASAVLQMIVYFSALAPCIAFTYLLRGIDIPTIFLALTYAFVFSLLFSSLGLLIGAMARHAHLQVGLSALFVVLLVVSTWLGLMSAIGLLFSSGTLGYDLAEFWIANMAIVSFAISFVVLNVGAAAAAISFASANRSTPLRYIMLAQQVLFVGWFSYLFVRFPDDASLGLPLIPAVLYWALMGALMTGEHGELSPRARRTLPQTALGRITLTWFNPGSGTGYVFAVCNMVTIALVATVLPWFVTQRGSGNIDRSVVLAWLLVGYLAMYLGLGRLLLVTLRRRGIPISLQAALLIQSLLIAAGAALPPALQLLDTSWYSNQYTILQAPNWVWTSAELIARGTGGSVVSSITLIIILGFAALVANLLSAAREVAQERMITPDRVRADEAS